MITYRRQISDYTRMCLRLAWQRQAMLAGGMLMAIHSVDFSIALILYGMCQLGELHDLRVCRNAGDWSARTGRNPAIHVRRMALSAALSAACISVSMVVVAFAEGPSLHLGPLSFLFAAGLYATMNNCHVPRLMYVRLSFYAAALFFIPLFDLILARPALGSPLWMQMLVVLFLLFMWRECAQNFVASYVSVRRRMVDLRQERDQVTEAYAVQSKFVSIVSHELRTPLTSIKASLDLIAGVGGTLSSTDIRQVAGIGQKNTDRLALLIDDLLDFQKLNAGKMVFRMEPLDLGDLVQEAVEVNRAIGAQQDIDITVAVPDNPVPMIGDRDRLHQVLVNMLSNAVKFSDAGCAVDVAVEVSSDIGRVTVRDRGIGIPDDARDLVFAPFSQVDVSDGRAFGGTGLGMSISKAIVEEHNGTLDFESELGEGTTFIMTFDLPPGEHALASDSVSGMAEKAGVPATIAA